MAKKKVGRPNHQNKASDSCVWVKRGFGAPEIIRELTVQMGFFAIGVL
jgi:hypothetical protein